MSPSSTRGGERTLLDRFWEHGFRAPASRRYALALAGSVLALLTRIALNPIWGGELPYVLYFPVTLFAALYGGFAPALAGVAVMGLGTWFFVLHPLGRLAQVEAPALVGLVVYVLVDAMIAWVSAKHRALLSERHASAVADAERATLLQTVLDTSPSPIWISLDARGDRIVGNAAGDALLATPTGTNISLSAPDGNAGYRALRGGVDVPVEQLPMQRAARDGVTVRAEELEIVRADGSRVWLLMHASPLRPSGAVSGAVSVGMDITDRKLWEQRVAADLDAMTQLQHLGTVLASSYDARAHLETALDVAIAISGADKGNIQILDQASGVLTIAAQRGFAEPFLTFFQKVDASDPWACGAATAIAKPVLVADVLRSDIFSDRLSLQVLLEEGIRAVQSTPLVSTDGRLIGMLSVHFAVPHQPEDRVLRLVNILSRQLADYLERGSMFVDLRYSAESDAYRVRLSDALRAGTSDRRIQAAASELLGHYLGASRCYFGEVEVDNEHALVVADYCAGNMRSIVGRHRLAAFGPSVIDTLRSGMAISITDIQTAPELSPAERSSFQAIDTQSVAAAPLLRDGALVAVFGIGHATPRVWEQDELLLLRETGERVWSTVEAARAVARLRDSEERFRTISEALPSLVFDATPAGLNTFVNQAFCDFAGRPPEGLLGDRWLELAHPDDLPGSRKVWDEAVAAGRPFVCEYRLRRHDGAWRWHLCRSVPQKDGSGAIRRWIGTATDITDLRETQEALREADRRKDEFLAILAHELRNPLAPIRTSLELLHHAAEKPGTLEYLRPILERQVAQMVRLIDDLLEVSRITTGKIHLQREPALLSELVRNAVEANREAIATAGLELSVSIPEPPCVLDVDPTRFVQIISNLLHNATKFTEPGGRVSITAQLDAGAASTGAGSPRLRLTVSDSGIGIAADALPRVFDLFVQGAEGREGKTGLGIGLALARQLVEGHGGTIMVASDGPGRGTSFTIEMPVLSLGDIAPSPQRTVPAAPIARRVLIVDDNVDAADTLATFVHAIGGHAQTANSGEDGVRVASEFRPEVVLLDIGLPGIDGYETCRRLRAGVVQPETSIIAVTGWGKQQDRARAFASGFDAHLTKPADPGLLERLLADPPRVRFGSRS